MALQMARGDVAGGADQREISSSFSFFCPRISQAESGSATCGAGATRPPFHDRVSIANPRPAKRDVGGKGMTYFI